MSKAYKFRIYPSKEQEELFAKTFGCVRKVWNLMLEDKIKHYEKTKEKLNCYPSQYKEEYPFLKEVDSLALSNAQINLQTAYNNFFRSPQMGFPKPKTLRNSCKSYTTNNQKGNIRIENNKLKLPKVGWVKIKQHRVIPEEYRLKSVTVKNTPTGKFFVSILFEYDSEFLPIEASKETTVAIHYTNRHMFLDSNGVFAGYPKYYSQSMQQLAREQRRLSKMKRGSKNSEKQRMKVARIHETIANQRKDFLHKLSREYCSSYNAVIVEDFDMKEIAKSFKLGKSTNDNAFGMFRTYLSYKLAELGKTYIAIPQFFPSSITCNHCGTVNHEVTLDRRIWTCVCGYTHDRETNAVMNVLKYGLAELQLA